MSSEIFVYWGPRRQSLADCSAKVSKHLRVLSHSDESLINWRAQRGSRKSALKLDAFTYENVSVISSELLKGVNKTDIKPKVIIEELGYRISLWNSAANGVDAKTEIQCGAHSEYLSPVGQNKASIELEYAGVAAFSTKVLLKIFEEFILMWNPVYGFLRHSSGEADKRELAHYHHEQSAHKEGEAYDALDTDSGIQLRVLPDLMRDP